MTKKDEVSVREEEKIRVQKIREGNEKVFEDLFFEYYQPLYKYSRKILRSKSLAADAVQDVFMKIWLNREDWAIYYSIKVYLFQAVRNQSLDLLEKQNKQQNISRKISENGLDKQNKKYKSTGKQNNDSLVKNIWNIAAKLPERRRTVFTLYQQDGLSYKEISVIMGITRKTVENHMALALKSIRSQLDTERLMSYGN